MTIEEFLDKLGDHGQEGFMYHPNEREAALMGLIQSAILAEREACALIAEESNIDYAKLEKMAKSDQAKLVFRNKAIASQTVMNRIRARSNPETPNKALESPENLQSSTYHTPALKTCT